ncbi:kinase-like protein [Coniophora puteana RWD-64-598 SS2]|uniref:Kinase-like protein n=1 Tax=Coniophora puteana (strain RWD-64-598) TaxID=741705 RepID=A0A5M3MD83_CONPW|nr:kinase-like protein [Coniophora puteana RWD-64-598 SS2]EIW77212.1 kinase-like protein [Coniophora puteana RWD-64-598 SS2]
MNARHLGPYPRANANELLQVVFYAILPLKELPDWTTAIKNGNESQSDPPNLTGNVKDLGRHPVAHGGYGDIYEANLQIAAGKPMITLKVAVKALRRPPLNDVEMRKGRKRIGRELRVWKQLDHENIIPLCGLIYDEAKFGPFPAMICPWAERGSLHSYISSSDGTRLSSLERFCILRDVAAGLQYRKNMSNVSIQRITGDNYSPLSGHSTWRSHKCRACLADFGLSTIIAEFGNTYFSSVRQGALRWAAPEALIIPQEGKVVLPTARGDVYSFGSIILQACKVPYHYIKNDNALVGEVYLRKKPRRLSRPVIADTHWSFMEECWLSEKDGAYRPSVKEICKFVDSQVDLHIKRTVIVIPVSIPIASHISDANSLKRYNNYDDGPAFARGLSSRYAQAKVAYHQVAEDLILTGEAFKILKQIYKSPPCRLAILAEELHDILEMVLQGQDVSNTPEKIFTALQKLLRSVVEVLDAEFHASHAPDRLGNRGQKEGSDTSISEERERLHNASHILGALHEYWPIK